jgi:phosphoribosylformylglycinamidine (FGAM) synthase-like enzyme
MILKYSVHPRIPGESATVRRQRELLDLLDLESWRDYYIEVHEPPAGEAATALQAALGDPLTETVRIGEPIEPGRMVQVTYKRGIVDNENDSIVAFSQLFGVEAVAARVGTTYVSADPALAERVRAQLVNPNIEELHEREPAYETLGPQGSGAPPERYDLCAMSDEQLAAVGTADGRNLSLEQMCLLRRIQRELGLSSVTDVLIEAADARWSDHCLHTTWKSLGNLLGKLKDASRRTANPNILSMFEDNAGVWDFYDGWAIALKGETHSGPSAVSAYFGQLTKLGGVLRDILGTGLGADPIGSFEYTATGPADRASPIPGRPSPRQIGRETIRAIKEYGNTFGVPMMRAHMTFHPDYIAKPFALGGSIGLIPVQAAQRGKPQPGDLLMLIGGLTGNDGIHGASASSAGSEMDEASVQIGSPLEEVAFRQAIVDLRDAGCLRALTDVGGAGLNSAVGEIGDPGGVWLNTALVPLKTAGLPTWRILLSESQERMLLAVVPERLEAARELLERHRVRHTVVGRFTDDGRYTVVHLPEVRESEVVEADALPDGEQAVATGFSVPYELLEYEPPRRSAPAPPAADPEPVAWPALDREALAALVPRVLADPEVASQRFASSQYDTTVMGLTAYGPGAGPHHVPTSYWAGAPLPGSPAAVLFATAFDPWLFERHPVRALRQLFLRIVGTLVLAGVAVQDVCLCDNFYTPHLHPDGDAWLVGMVDELAALVERFGTPVISGKDSSAGSVVTPEGIVHVPPAVFLSALGKLPDRARLRRNEWTAPGNLLVRIGPDTPSPGGTVAGRLLGLPATQLDAPDLDASAAYLGALRAVPEGAIASARPIGSGGTLAALLLGGIASGLGAELDAAGDGDLAWLLAEHRCGALAEVPEPALDRLPQALAPHVVGRVTDRPASLRLDGAELAEGAVETWTTSWEPLLR